MPVVLVVYHPPPTRNRKFTGPAFTEPEVETVQKLYKGKPVYVEHDSSKPAIGHVKSFQRGPNGELMCYLYIDSSTAAAKEVIRKIKQGEYRDVSIGFLAAVSEDYRMFDQFVLQEISIVEKGAMPNTNIVLFGDEEGVFASPEAVHNIFGGKRAPGGENGENGENGDRGDRGEGGADTGGAEDRFADIPDARDGFHAAHQGFPQQMIKIANSAATGTREGLGGETRFVPLFARDGGSGRSDRSVDIPSMFKEPQLEQSRSRRTEESARRRIKIAIALAVRNSKRLDQERADIATKLLASAPVLKNDTPAMSAETVSAATAAVPGTTAATATTTTTTNAATAPATPAAATPAAQLQQQQQQPPEPPAGAAPDASTSRFADISLKEIFEKIQPKDSEDASVEDLEVTPENLSLFFERYKQLQAENKRMAEEQYKQRQADLQASFQAIKEYNERTNNQSVAGMPHERYAQSIQNGMEQNADLIKVLASVCTNHTEMSKKYEEAQKKFEESQQEIEQIRTLQLQQQQTVAQQTPRVGTKRATPATASQTLKIPRYALNTDSSTEVKSVYADVMRALGLGKSASYLVPEHLIAAQPPPAAAAPAVPAPATVAIQNSAARAQQHAAAAAAPAVQTQVTGESVPVAAKPAHPSFQDLQSYCSNRMSTELLS